MKTTLALTFVAVAVLAAASCRGGGKQDFKLPADPANYQPLKRYQAMAIPDDNPMTEAKARLGWQLFFDKRLSGDGSRSCYSCHLNEKGLSDGLPLAKGAYEKALSRNSPTLWNIGYHTEFYWDGRAKSFEGQALAAWKLANMGAKDPAKDEIRADIIEKLNAVPGYRSQFQAVFGGPATEKNVAQALTTYMRTIISGNTPWDRWQAGDEKAVTDSAKRGYEIFERIKCTNCHVGVLMTSMQFYNVGIGMDKPTPDVGRFKVTNLEKDKGAFKAPTLRDVADSAPYFHDGSVATLEEAVKLMVGGGIENPNLDRVNLQKADLTPAEFQDLVAFLRSLDEPSKLPIPTLP